MVVFKGPIDISAIVLCHNSAKSLASTLESLTGLAEVILVDTGSTDNSLDIASQFPNVKIFKEPFSGFGLLRQKAISFTNYEWVLSLDSDEALSIKALDEIHHLTLDPLKVYSFPFHNYFHGKWIKGCGWYPDRHPRLFNKKATTFSDDAVHEKLLIKPHMEVKLKSPIYHFSYQSVSDFMIKMHRYAELFAKQNVGKKKVSFYSAMAHGLFAFCKSFIMKKGCLCGKEGFMISLYNSQTAYYKYLKLWELTQTSTRSF